MPRKVMISAADARGAGAKLPKLIHYKLPKGGHSAALAARIARGAGPKRK